MKLGRHLHPDLRATYLLRHSLRLLSPHIGNHRTMSSHEYLNRPLHEADGPLVWIDCEMTGRPFMYSSILLHGSILHCTLDG